MTTLKDKPDDKTVAGMLALPSLDRLNELLEYDPCSGRLTWKESRGSAQAGTEAGRVNERGYRMVTIDRVKYCSHRIAWKMYHSVDPSMRLDHINQQRADNRISNLREAPQVVNCRNQKKHRTNTSGHTGVCWHARWRKWFVRIEVGGATKNLGYFSDIDEAARVRKEAESKYGFSENHGKD